MPGKIFLSLALRVLLVGWHPLLENDRLDQLHGWPFGLFAYASSKERSD